MGKFTVTHEIHCNQETFWKVFFDQPFNIELYKTHLRFPDFRIIDQRETTTEIIRKCAGTPKMDVPGPVAKLIGSNFSYQEEGKFNKATGIWQWKMQPSTLADKMRNEGSMRIEPIGDNKVRRIADILIEAKIFGVGGLLESSGEKQLREGWAESAVFMNDWIKKHP